MLIAQYIYQFARETPDAPAMIHNGRSLSYSAIAGATSSTATEISSLGVPSSGTVAVKARNLADCWVMTLALQARGYTTICISSLELLGSLNVENLVALFVSAGDQDDALDSLPVFVLSKPDFSSAAPPGAAPSPGPSGQCGHILYTSGTTGNYKMYLLTTETQLPRDEERCRYYHWDNNTRFHGLGFGLWTAIGYNLPPSVWSVGGCVVLDQRDDWPSHFYDSHPTFAYLLPDMAAQLSETKNPRFLEAAESDDLILYVAGGFLSNRVANRLRENVTRNILITYGSSEINSASFEQTYQSMEDLGLFTPTGNRVLEVVDEQGQVCPMNREGHLRVKLTDLDTQEYLNDPEASSSAFRNGYFYPGDMAVQREDGKFRILGRVADVVNLGGKKLSVAPIEANLQNVLEVDYVCLFSGIDASGETVIVVAIEATSPPDEDRLNHIGRELSQWGEVRFACVSPFPRTRSGTRKIDRILLKELVFRNLNA